MNEAVKTLLNEKRMSYIEYLNLADEARISDSKFYYRILSSITKHKLKSSVADYFIIDNQIISNDKFNQELLKLT